MHTARAGGHKPREESDPIIYRRKLWGRRCWDTRGQFGVLLVDWIRIQRIHVWASVLVIYSFLELASWLIYPRTGISFCSQQPHSSGVEMPSPFECSVCMEHFNDDQRRPMSLLCGHSYCLDCISRMPERICPSCRGPFTTPAPNFSLLDAMSAPSPAPASGTSLVCVWRGRGEGLGGWWRSGSNHIYRCKYHRWMPCLVEFWHDTWDLTKWSSCEAGFHFSSKWSWNCLECCIIFFPTMLAILSWLYHLHM